MENVISNFGFVNIHKGIFYLLKFEKLYLHIWLTTYPKQNFIFPKKEKRRGKLISNLGFAASKGGMPIF